MYEALDEILFFLDLHQYPTLTRVRVGSFFYSTKMRYWIMLLGSFLSRWMDLPFGECAALTTTIPS